MPLWSNGHLKMDTRIRSSGRSTRQQQINDAIGRALKRADVPSTKEPACLLRGDGKRPDGLTLVPWQSGRGLTWDVTIVDSGQLLYANHVCDTLCSGESSSNAEESQVRRNHPVAYFRSHSHRDSGTNQYGWSTLP